MMGSTAGTAKDVIDDYRARGVKVGLLKLRLFRPFPATEIAAALKGRKAVAVLDRAISFGAPQGMGPLFTEITSALYNEGVSGLKIVNYIYGLGGRDTLPAHIESAYADLEQVSDAGDGGRKVRYLGLREA